METITTESEIKDLIRDCGAVLQGHFRLASGRHSDVYIEKFRLLERPEVLAQVCQPIAEHFKGTEPEVIAGPSTGGIVVAYELARQLGVPAVYVEEEGGKRILKRGATIAPGARVLLVDDVLTTGISLIETLSVVRGSDAEVVGVGVLIDRSGKAIDFGAEFYASCHFDATSYAEDEVPGWLAEIPLSVPGTRAKLRAKKG